MRSLSLIFFLVAALSGFGQEEDSIKMSVDIEDVVVTAQYAPTSSKNAIHQIQTIDKAEIELRGAQNLEQLLSNHLNMRINQDPFLGSSLNLMGLSGQGVKIMIDGVPIIGRRDGNLDLSQINLQNVEKVEIVEGPLSVNYGTDALAGVINLITKKSQLNKFTGGVEYLYEDRGENRLAANVGVRITNDLLFMVDAGWNQFDGYSEDTLRSVLWNPKDKKYGGASLRYIHKNDQDFRFSSNYFLEQVDDLGEVRRPQFKPYSLDDYYTTERWDHSFTHKGKFLDNYHIQTTAAYNYYNRRKKSVRLNMDEGEEILIDGAQDTSIFNSYILRSTFASSHPEHLINGQFGFDLRYDNASGARIVDMASDETNFAELGDYAVFASARYKLLDKVRFEGGLRYAYNTRYSTPLVPSLHAHYKVDDVWTIRASYARGFRSPSIKELFFQFIDINHYIVGNPDLGPETSDNVQVASIYERDFKGHKVNMTLKGFYNNVQDLIDLYEFVELPDGSKEPVRDTTTLRFSYFNLERFISIGGDLSVEYIFKNLKLGMGTSYIGYYNADHEALTGVKPFSFEFEWNQEVSYTFPNLNLTLSAFTRGHDRRINFFPTQDSDGNAITGQRIQDGYVLADFIAIKRFWKDRISLKAGVKNILNVGDVRVNGTDSNGQHQSNLGVANISPGRNFFFGLGIQF